MFFAALGTHAFRNLNVNLVGPDMNINTCLSTCSFVKCTKY